MKHLILFVSCLLSFASAFAQAPDAFKYQAVVRNSSGNILGNQAVGMQLIIHQGSATGTAVYTETFATTTNAYGLVNLEIGTGTTSGNFSSINWANGPYFIETAVDINGGTAYSSLGTSQLVSVPYALYAEVAGSAAIDNVNDADADPTNELQTWTSLPGIPADILDGDDVGDADSDPTNELQTWTSLPGIPADILDGDQVNDADSDPLNEIQTLSLAANNLSLTSGGSVSLTPYLDNTDAQTLTLVGNSLSISNGNSVTVPNGDITDVVAGNGLTGGGSAGSVTLTANATNGLNVDATSDAVEMGGALTKNTTIAHGANNLIHNLDGTGDFLVQDGGITTFEVRDNGQIFNGNDMFWNDGSTAGTTLASIIDDTDDGRFLLYENGTISLDFDANSQFIFNEQGFDRDFRVESDNDANAFFVNAGTDRVGIGTTLPLAKLHVIGGAIMPDFGSGLSAGIRWQDNAFGGGLDEAAIQYISEVGENSTLRITNNNDWDDDISFHQMGADRMVINDGKVGIGTSAPTFQFEVATNSAAKPTSNTWTVTSDRRLKTDITPYANGLEDLMRIEPVWFTYNGKAGMPLETGVGVIAQDLQAIAPYMIKTWNYREPDGGTTEYLGVDNGAMTYMLINAVKEQQGIIEDQRGEIDSLKSSLEALERRMQALEKK